MEKNGTEYCGCVWTSQRDTETIEKRNSNEVKCVCVKQSTMSERGRFKAVMEMERGSESRTSSGGLASC